MNFFSKLFRSRDKPTKYISTHWPCLWGQSTSGQTVNDRTAMQVTAVYACVRILAEAIAGLPLNVYQYRPDGSKEKLYSHSLYHLLHDEPNPEMTSFIFRETMMSHLLLHCNGQKCYRHCHSYRGIWCHILRQRSNSGRYIGTSGNCQGSGEASPKLESSVFRKEQPQCGCS